ncbi:MAG: hypothetical protein ACLQU4_20530 [Limisphaerales bacterium]
MMLVAFPKDADGGFDIPGLAISVAGAWFSIMTAFSFLPKAIRTGRIPYGFFNGYWSSKTYWLEREKHPVWFWILFASYSLGIPMGILVVSLGLFGWGRKLH